MTLQDRFMGKRWQISAATLILALAQLILIFWAAAQIDAGGAACDVYCGQGNLIIWYLSLLAWLALWIGSVVAAMSAWSRRLRAVSIITYVAFAAPVVVPVVWIAVRLLNKG